jgi:hypothetical protein
MLSSQPFQHTCLLHYQLQNIHLRSRKVLKPKDSIVIIEEEMEEEETLDHTNNDDQPEEVVIPITQTPSTSQLQQP